MTENFRDFFKITSQDPMDRPVILCRTPNETVTVLSELYHMGYKLTQRSLNMMKTGELCTVFRCPGLTFPNGIVTCFVEQSAKFFRWIDFETFEEMISSEDDDTNTGDVQPNEVFINFLNASTTRVN